ncbi:MAG TPA: DUF1573 domain-containing protein [Bacteroidales bacterium]|nr:DUF1573 domain-containing protein [Bacteroidales bacterium]
MRSTGLAIATLMMLFALEGCRNDVKQKLPADIVHNPNSAEHQGNRNELPVISFDRDEHDFGRIIQGEVVTYAFKFTNTGKSDLLIASVSTSCGCTVSKYSREPVKSGEQGTIQVTFDSEGRKGFQNKSITVLSNAQPNRHELHIKARVEIPEE